MTILLYRLVAGFRFEDHRNQLESYDGREMKKMGFGGWIEEGSLEAANKPNSEALSNGLFVGKRSRNKHRSLCSCPTIEEVRDFGADSYPRRHKERLCDHKSPNNVCTSGQCRELYHTIHVLKRKPDNHQTRSNEHKLPTNIREEYFLDTEVSEPN